MAERQKRPRDETEELNPQSFWKAQLEAIYVRRNPMKVDSIPELLQKYKGSEAVLYKKVCHKYDLNPEKFHTEEEAWLEYELTEHHGPKNVTGVAPVAGAENGTLELEVSTISGDQSFKVLDLKPWNTVKEALIRASEGLGIPAWTSRLCHGTQRLQLDDPLGQSGVTSGSHLTLVQEPCPELTTVLERFMPGPLEAGACEVDVAWCQDLEISFNGRCHTRVLGAFHQPASAREAVVKDMSLEYQRAMNNQFRAADCGEECMISSSANSITLSLPDVGLRKVWQVERGPLR